MADANDKRRDIEAQINKLSGDTAKYYRDQLNTLIRTNAALTDYDLLLSDVNDRVSAISDGFGEIESQLNGIVNELKSANSASKDITKAFSSLRSVAQKLKYDQQGITDLNEDQLKKEKSKIKILHDQLKVLAKEAKRKEDIGEALTEQEIAVIAAYDTQFDIIKDINAALDNRIKKEEKYNRTLGVTGVLLSGLGKIPIVGPLLKTNEALDLAREKAKAGGNAFTVMGTAIASMGKSLVNNLVDPLVMTGLIVAAFKKLLELGFKVDKTQTELAKSFSLSADSASRMYQSFNDIQASNQPLVKGLDKALLNTSRMSEAALELGQAFNGALIPTRSQLENQILLTKQIGLSTEEANSLQQLAYQNNLTADDITQEVLSQTKAYRNQTGVQLNNKKILQDVSKINGQLRLQYGNNVKQLTSAVIQANKLGISLEQSKNIAEKLLNFEQSIEDELSAELLIGRDLNLEQARLLALNGKSAEAVALLAQEMGGSAGFAAMNVIQQEALAKALGMNADEMSNMMIYQEQLNSLGNKASQQIKDRIQELEKEGRFEEAQQLKRDIANGVAAEEALKRIDNQTTFNQAVERLQLLLADLVDDYAKPLSDLISHIASNMNGIVFAAKALGAAFLSITLGKLLLQLGSASVLTGTMAASAITAIGVLTLGAGLVAAGVGIAAAMGAFSSNKEEGAKLPSEAKFATGGIVTSRIDNATIGERGPEAIIPLSSPSAKQMMNGGGPIQVTVYGQIDKQTLFTFIAESEKENAKDMNAERNKQGYKIH